MEWIKVIDRLPELGTHCLVYNKLGHQTITRFTDRNSTYGYHYKTAWFTKSGRQMSKANITHWMPLPPPPKK